MSKKSVPKEITEKERLENEKQTCISSIKTEYHLKNAANPTYFFDVGDKVVYGVMKESTVEAIYNSGAVYLLRCLQKINNYGNPYLNETYRAVAWYQIRPIKHIEDTQVRNNEDICISFNNGTIESLIHKYYYFGIDMNPDYQRDFVWDNSDKEMLLDSIFHNIDIGKFVLVHLSGEEWAKRDVTYEILDGKQRLSTIIAFYENRLTYKGLYYNDLFGRDKSFFLNHAVSIGILSETSKEDVYRHFLMLNTTGKRVGDAQIQLVKEMLNLTHLEK